LESPIAFAQQHADIAAAIVGYGEVRLPIPIEVSHGYRVRCGSSVVIDRRLESPIALAQQHAYIGDAAEVGHGEVRLTVPVEVPYGYRVRKASGVVVDRSLEPALWQGKYRLRGRRR